jgi:hypothetical protein
MQTRHIFDEFPEIKDELTDERKHQKRLRLEPLIYDILKARYLKPLEEFWNTYEIPMNSDKCVVLVERRIHENLYFILRNIAYFARGWAVCIVCSDINLDYCKEISGHNKDRITFFPIFKGNPDAKRGKAEYNTLLKTPEFYKMLDSEKILLMETDTYLRKTIPDEIFNYDYVASPYAWDLDMAGGGLSFRKRSTMITICEKMGLLPCDQDTYICAGVKELGYKMPEITEAVTYFSESCMYVDGDDLCGPPIGVHQWWTFFTNGMDEAEWIFNAMLTLDI